MTAYSAGSGELDGKVALVTGAGSGIGYAIAERFANEGAAVAIDYFGHDANAQALARDLNAAGAKAVAIEAGVTDAATVEALVAQIVERFGRLDVLVNNAGIEKSHRCSRSTKPAGTGRSRSTSKDCFSACRRRRGG